MFISLTRLRVRRWWYMPLFMMWAQRSIQQARKTAGYREGRTLVDRHRVFWTLTGWDNESAMKAYRGADPHRKAMKKQAAWCDEGSVVNWEADTLPTWIEAWERMQSSGRFTPLKYPSEAQKEKRIERPRTQPLIEGKI